jgi:hypothetical protein
VIQIHSPPEKGFDISRISFSGHRSLEGVVYQPLNVDDEIARQLGIEKSCRIPLHKKSGIEKIHAL